MHADNPIEVQERGTSRHKLLQRTHRATFHSTTCVSHLPISSHDSIPQVSARDLIKSIITYISTCMDSLNSGPISMMSLIKEIHNKRWEASDCSVWRLGYRCTYGNDFKTTTHFVASGPEESYEEFIILSYPTCQRARHSTVAPKGWIQNRTVIVIITSLSKMLFYLSQVRLDQNN